MESTTQAARPRGGIASKEPRGVHEMHAVSRAPQPVQSFRPFPLLANPHLQTIVAAHVCLPCEPPSLPRLIQLPDTDLIALEVSTPAGWHPTDPTVVLL